jgi:UDPglucose 6-dehydrogenase
MEHVKKIYGDKIQFAAGQYEALPGADALIICTEWNEFRTPDFDKIAYSLKAKVVFDGRNLYDVPAMESMGFHYESVGRKTV